MQYIRKLRCQGFAVSSFSLIYAERFYYSRDAKQFNYNQTFAIIFFGDKLCLYTHTHAHTHYVCPKCVRNFQHRSIMSCTNIILFMSNFACGCVLHILYICLGTESKCGTQIINPKIPEFNDDFMEFGLISLEIFR